jgi:hypothetical protein
MRSGISPLKNLSVAGTTIVPGSFVETSIRLSNVLTGAESIASLNVTLSARNTFPRDGMINLTFPVGFSVQLVNGFVSSPSSGNAGTKWQAAVHGQVVVVTRFRPSPSELSAGTSFQLDFSVKNPIWVGYAGNFSVLAYTSKGHLIDQAQYVSGPVITPRCTGNSTSAEGSDAITDCKCIAGSRATQMLRVESVGCAQQESTRIRLTTLPAQHVLETRPQRKEVIRPPTANALQVSRGTPMIQMEFARRAQQDSTRMRWATLPAQHVLETRPQRKGAMRSPTANALQVSRAMQVLRLECVRRAQQESTRMRWATLPAQHVLETRHSRKGAMRSPTANALQVSRAMQVLRVESARLLTLNSCPNAVLLWICWVGRSRGSNSKESTWKARSRSSNSKGSSVEARSRGSNSKGSSWEANSRGSNNYWRLVPRSYQPATALCQHGVTLVTLAVSCRSRGLNSTRGTKSVKLYLGPEV